MIAKKLTEDNLELLKWPTRPNERKRRSLGGRHHNTGL